MSGVADIGNLAECRRRTTAAECSAEFRAGGPCTGSGPYLERRFLLASSRSCQVGCNECAHTLGLRDNQYACIARSGTEGAYKGEVADAGNQLFTISDMQRST